jgi:hypothetical protein
MKRILLVLTAVAAIFPAEVQAGDEGWETSSENFYVGASAAVVLPEGGGDMRRQGAAAVRGGVYVADLWAVECEFALLERSAAVTAAALWHWWGYERFDPYFRFGARVWTGRCDEAGPMAGTGAFFHLSDNLSLRFDADAVLGVERENEMAYTIAAGVQWSF